MTTIACTKTEIACDLQGTIGGDRKLKRTTKIHYCEANELTYPNSDFYIGFAGDTHFCLEVADWFKHPDKIQAPRMRKSTQFLGLVLTLEGHIFYLSHPGKWIAVNDKYYAIGSGNQPALGAMHAGATAAQAIKAATHVDPFTGMGVKSYKI